MKLDKETSIKNYMSYLVDIYNGEKSCRDLTAKHRISSTAQMAAKLASLVDHNGYSLMSKPPTMYDVKSFMKARHQIERKRIAARKKDKAQLKLSLVPAKIKSPAKIKTKTNTREISILWGAIKINY